MGRGVGGKRHLVWGWGGVEWVDGSWGGGGLIISTFYSLLISFLGTLEMCPKSKLNFEIIYFVLREQREGANSEIKKRRKLKNIIM